MKYGLFFFFFFQAEDGIRDRDVTGVQTCALPILNAVSGGVKKYGAKFILVPTAEAARDCLNRRKIDGVFVDLEVAGALGVKIGRASCRERVEIEGGEVGIKEIEKRVYVGQVRA